jgi:FkbM family methyltransferase
MAWRFIRGLEVVDHDVGFGGRKAVMDLLREAQRKPGCGAVNTLGFFKTLDNMCLKPSPYFGPGDGTYVLGPAVPAHVLGQLQDIHARLPRFMPKDLQSIELAEQQVIVEMVPPTATVLELGGNVGRASCVLASVLNDSSRLVVVEPDPASAEGLARNRDAHGFRFHVECCAVSSEPLVQRGWNTAPPSAATADWTPITTVPWRVLVDRYPHLRFDTLVVDNEGGLFSTLRDNPGLLADFNLLVVENDYGDEWQKRFVDAEATRAGLTLVLSRPLGYALPSMPCTAEFYQAWARDDATRT